MRSRALTASLVAVLAGLAVLVSCMGPGITDSSRHDPNAVPTALQLGPSLVQCPTSESSTATSVVTALGGLITVDGTSISIPAGALLSPATVTVTVPASQYMEVDISVEGSSHFVFELPVTVTLSYARCDRNDIDHSPLSVWHIDSDTKALLELMGGIDDKLLRTVTFTTGHLSGYAVGN